jgi:hypothetical protein
MAVRRPHQLPSRHHPVLDRAGLEKALCEGYAIVKERFDAFLTPPSTAVQGHNEGRTQSKMIEKD